MTGPFEIVDQRSEERDCSECGKGFRATVIVTGTGATYGSDHLCDTCLELAEQAEADRRHREEVAERLRRSGLPRPLWDVDFSGFTHPGAIDAAKRWATDGGGLCLTGPVGVGKTRLAAAAVRLRVERRGVRWVSVARLMTQMRAAFNDDARYEASRIVAGTGAVCLDDLDKVNPSEFGREVLYTAIDNRYSAGSPLIVTTNLPPSEIGRRLGEPIMSRLVGYCAVFELGGSDRRLTQGEAA